MEAFSDGLDAVAARFAFGASAGFPRAWSVIHPLLWEKASKLRNQRANNSQEDHGFASVGLHSCTRALVCGGWRHPTMSVLGARGPVFLG